MAEIMIKKADARLIADAASDCADKAILWKDRALNAEAVLAHFVDWVRVADDPNDDAQYLNGEHAEQRAANTDGWDDLRDLAESARALLNMTTPPHPPIGAQHG